jgi:hypothetical protein
MMSIDELLARTIFFDGANIPFADVTVAQARGRADELKAAVGFGPTARIAPVALAWRELVHALEQAGAERVGQLPPEAVEELAPKLWVVPPGGSLL